MRPIHLDKLMKLDPNGISLTVKVSPKSHRDEIKGLVGLPHSRVGLAVRVSPPAADGAANEAVICLIANLFDVPHSRIEIKSGATARVSRRQKSRHKDEWIAMQVPAIISEKEFNRTQKLLHARSPNVTPPRITSSNILLTGLARCESCGGALMLRTAPARTAPSIAITPALETGLRAKPPATAPSPSQNGSWTPWC